MKLQYQKVILIPILVGALAGCASQGGQKDTDINPVCAALGAVVGGGTAAAITIAAGPIGAGVGVGAFLGAMACHQMATQNVAVTQTNTAQHSPAPVPAPAPAPAPAPVAVPVDADSDGDGVADRLDRCPGTPPGTRVDSRGCPDVLLTLTGINFKFDSSALDPTSSAILDRAVATLAATQDVTVRVEGHCDSTGTDAYNLALSQRRAQAVSAYLVAHGVTKSRLKAVGMGEGRPVAPNDTEQGRFQNRRVEFHVEHGATAADTNVETWRDVDRSASTHEMDDTTRSPR